VDHQYIEEHDIVSLYSIGKLPAGERREFEEHFIECPQCLDQMELLGNFRSGLKQVAEEDAAEARLRGSSPGWLTLLSGWQRVALAAAACMLVALPVLFLSQLGRLREELNRTQLASLDLQHHLEQQQRANGTLQQQLQERQTPAGAAIFQLNTVRSAAGSSEPENRITVSPAIPWVTLSLERDYEPEYRDYRATLADAKGVTIWRQEHLVPASRAAMGIVLPSNLFHAGYYELKLEGMTQDGRYFATAHYRIRANLKN
jgi:hypothetical protein